MKFSLRLKRKVHHKDQKINSINRMSRYKTVGNKNMRQGVCKYKSGVVSYKIFRGYFIIYIINFQL